MFRIVERPKQCSYLPNERASLEVTLDPRLTPQVYGELLRRGYRRFGWQLFRPVCSQCQACVSMRVVVPQHRFSAGDRRIDRQNKDIRCQLYSASATDQHVALYNRYQAFMHVERGWALQSHSLQSYFEGFVAGPKDVGWEWRYFDGDRLVGVALMDMVPGAISLVYFFYDPGWRRLSPGKFSILNQLKFARENGADYAYLGYWVGACGSLNYKSRFRPHETLRESVPLTQDPVWIHAEEPQR